jgi:hypothetical protein
MREKQFSATQRTVLNMLLMDPPTCAVEIKAAAEYLTVLADHIKLETEVRKHVWSERDLELVASLSQSLVSSTSQHIDQEQRNALITHAQLALIHPRLVVCLGDEIE